MPPNDNSNKDYTNMNYSGIAHLKILYISLIRLFLTHQGLDDEYRCPLTQTYTAVSHPFKLGHSRISSTGQ